MNSSYRQKAGAFHQGAVFMLTLYTLDGQTQVDSIPAGQPEQVSLNQCRLIAVNSPKLVLCTCTADGGDQVSL